MDAQDIQAGNERPQPYPVHLVHPCSITPATTSACEGLEQPLLDGDAVQRREATDQRALVASGQAFPRAVVILDGDPSCDHTYLTEATTRHRAT